MLSQIFTYFVAKQQRKQAPAFVSNCPLATANELNQFYARFDKMDFADEISAMCSELKALNDTPPRVNVETVATLFKKVNSNKAMGPDRINGKLLKFCANQLATPYSELFQLSLNECRSPACWKSAIVIPVPKTNRASQPNDYRPVALTSIVMKCFERVLTQFLFPHVSHLIDQLQFAYQPEKSVIDAVLTLIHQLAQHTDKLNCYARALFVDFSSAFNTMQIHVLLQKLHQMNVPPSLILWIKDFLSDRTQVVKVQNCLSNPITLNTGAPQGCVLSALLFILYTNDCRAKGENVSILKYADDTVIVGLMNNGDESNYRSNVRHFTEWCEKNYLQLNSTKTKEIVFDFRKSCPHTVPINIKGTNIEIVHKYKYLGTTVDNKLSWSEECKSIISKAHTRMYFLRKLKSLHVDRPILRVFYKSMVESILLFNCTVWFSSCKKEALKKMEAITKQASKIIGERCDLANECTDRIIKKANEIMSNKNHPLHNYYELLRSGRRLRSMKCRTKRFSDSFVPYSIRMCNNTDC